MTLTKFLLRSTKAFNFAVWHSIGQSHLKDKLYHSWVSCSKSVEIKFPITIKIMRILLLVIFPLHYQILISIPWNQYAIHKPIQSNALYT